MTKRFEDMTFREIREWIDKLLLENREKSESLVQLRQELKYSEKAVAKLEALEIAGVDNWQGYDEAMKYLDSDDD